jgi:hypothetical protein
VNTILEKYFEDIRALMPIGRTFIFFLSFCLSVLSHDEIDGSIVSRLLQVRLAEFSGDGALVGGALAADVLCGIFFVVMTWALFRGLSKKMISTIFSRLNFDEKMSMEYEKYARQYRYQLVQPAAIDYLRSEVERRLSPVKSFASLAELLFGMALLLSCFSFYSGAVDALFALPFILLAIVSESKSITTYLRRIVPLEFQISVLVGLKPKFELREA